MTSINHKVIKITTLIYFLNIIHSLVPIIIPTAEIIKTGIIISI